MQLHAIGDLAELDAATGPDGALRAAIRAQEEGLVGAVGITGHGDQAPATHLEALRRHPFATVLTPLNPVLWRDEAYRADYEALVDEVRRQDVGLMTIKTVSRRNWPEGAQHSHATWYEPYADQDRITAAVSWVLSHQEVTGIPTAGDVGCSGCCCTPSSTGSRRPGPRNNWPRTASTPRRSSRCPSEASRITAGGGVVDTCFRDAPGGTAQERGSDAHRFGSTFHSVCWGLFQGLASRVTQHSGSEARQ